VASAVSAARKGAARKGGTAGRRNTEHRDCGDRDNFALNLRFHDLAPCSLVEPELGHERRNSNIDLCWE